MEKDESGQHKQREEESFSFSTPIGFKGRVVGQHLIIMFVVVLCTGFVAYLVDSHDKRAYQVLNKVVDQIEMQTYVLSLPQADRAMLYLPTPKKLRGPFSSDTTDGKK